MWFFFPSSSVAAYISPPLLLCISFLLLYADFLFTVFDSQLWWHSDLWSVSRLEGHCTSCFCVCVARVRARLWFETCVVVCVCVTLKKSVSCHISHCVAVSAEPALSVSSWTPTLWENSSKIFWWNWLFFSSWRTLKLTLTLFLIFTSCISSESIYKWVKGLGSHRLISYHLCQIC